MLVQTIVDVATGVLSMRQQPQDRRLVSRGQYDAVLFDLDGVITNTAKLHAACWKQMFDEYLQRRANDRGEAFRPFDLTTDYRLYLDGKPRTPHQPREIWLFFRFRGEAEIRASLRKSPYRALLRDCLCRGPWNV